MTGRSTLVLLPVVLLALFGVPAAPAATAGTSMGQARPAAHGTPTRRGAPHQRVPGERTPRQITPTLVAVRAAHHPGYDRLVFEFRDGLPTERDVRYVPRIIQDGSGLPVRVVGDAFLQVRFFPANGHNDARQVTYGPTRRTVALPTIIQVVNSGDFEAVLSFGVGLARRTPFHIFTLTRPSQVVIDISTPFSTVLVRDYFLDSRAFGAGRPPYVRPVLRPVIPPAVGRGALQRLFAGPTQAELAAGLRFVDSAATGFTGLSVSAGIARVQLTGGCDSGGSTFTIANEIAPTLKQFPTVRYVKIFDPAGHTERPTGRVDSIPECLEP